MHVVPFDVFVTGFRRRGARTRTSQLLQSDLADVARERIVVLWDQRKWTGTVGRLIPHVNISDVAHVFVVPAMAAVATADLRERRGQLHPDRDAITAARDYLFLGA